MSSEGSVTSTGSRIRQFGLYRTIDARTNEFLKSSRKRQIRQGCACAAISTAITVTVVVVILLIYEYAIAVEWSLVQNKEGINRTDRNEYDHPYADKLDRSYFGFEQEYFERMPLLINALQESYYVDPTLETSGPLNKRKRFNITIIKTTAKSTFKPSPVRRTSPRPFYFEYRHPTPLPFSKTYGSRSWVEKYRNEERLKNIRQIIKYLENTIHAKVGDMHAKPTEKHIAFTGLYIEPMLNNKSGQSNAKSDLQSASSDNLKKFHLNHVADPLFNFKPDNPGDVNLLADDFLRFSPVPTPSLTSASNKHPMFRQIPFQHRNCLGNKCDENNKEVKNLLISSSEIKQTETPPLSTTKSFSVMLNLYPIKTKTESKKPELTTTTQSVEKIYLTTSRPLIQFKRKSNVAFRRLYTPYKRPRYLSKYNIKESNSDRSKENNIKETSEPDTQMIVHVQVYDENKSVINETNNINTTTFIPSTQTNPYTTKAPIEYSTSQIEDYHAGSSGYIPIATKADESLPKVTTVLPFFDTTTEYWNTPVKPPSDMVKFDIEDAKVPSQYIDFNRNLNEGEIEINRRNSGEMIVREKLLEEIDTSETKRVTYRRNFSKSLESEVEPSTLIIKLKNDLSKSTTQVPEIYKENIKSNEETTTTVWTYVPQINGHYRSINQNSRNVNKWLNANPENDRKKRLEMSVSGLHTYVPMYVEIKRNNSNTPNTQEIIENNDKV